MPRTVPQAVDLLQGLLAVEPSQRVSAADAAAHACFSESEASPNPARAVIITIPDCGGLSTCVFVPFLSCSAGRRVVLLRECDTGSRRHRSVW